MSYQLNSVDKTLMELCDLLQTIEASVRKTHGTPHVTSQKYKVIFFSFKSTKIINRSSQILKVCQDRK